MPASGLGVSKLDAQNNANDMQDDVFSDLPKPGQFANIVNEDVQDDYFSNDN